VIGGSSARYPSGAPAIGAMATGSWPLVEQIVRIERQNYGASSPWSCCDNIEMGTDITVSTPALLAQRKISAIVHYSHDITRVAFAIGNHWVVVDSLPPARGRYRLK
jgi:hypothetical protein